MNNITCPWVMCIYNSSKCVNVPGKCECTEPIVMSIKRGTFEDDETIDALMCDNCKAIPYNIF